MRKLFLLLLLTGCTETHAYVTVRPVDRPGTPSVMRVANPTARPLDVRVACDPSIAQPDLHYYMLAWQVCGLGPHDERARLLDLEADDAWRDVCWVQSEMPAENSCREKTEWR